MSGNYEIQGLKRKSNILIFTLTRKQNVHYFTISGSKKKLRQERENFRPFMWHSTISFAFQIKYGINCPMTIIYKLYFIKYLLEVKAYYGLPRWPSGKESICQCRNYRKLRFNPEVRKISWSRKWKPTPVFLPGKFCGQRSLTGHSAWVYRVGHN